MGAALLVSRLVLASVFAVAGVAKLADPAGARRAVMDFGVPERLAGGIAVMLPALELSVAIALVPLASARFAALGAALLLAGFVAVIARALARGQAPDCHCFGQVSAAPTSWRTLARNLVLLGIAVFVTADGWTRSGVSATHWVTRVDTPWLVAIGAAAVTVALLALIVWIASRLLAEIRRARARLETVEGSVQALASAFGVAANLGGAGEAGLGHGLPGTGLPVGSPAPEFELESVDGDFRSLGALLADARQLMLVFSDAACGPCNALLPDIAVWEQEREQALQIVVVASGDRGRNRAKAAEHGLQRMLLQSKHEVSHAYEARRTPMAVVIDAGGRIASPTVGGPKAIAALRAQAVGSTLGGGIPLRPSAWSSDVTAALSALTPDSSRVGRPAPDLLLADLDGSRVALKDLYAERIVAIFWNPRCSFCQRMLPDLRALEDDAPPDSPRLVVISSGEAGEVREQLPSSKVLVDADLQAMRAFGAGGTPTGVLVEAGRIASPVAAGADAVVRLIRSGSAADPAGSAASG